MGQFSTSIFLGDSNETHKKSPVPAWASDSLFVAHFADWKWVREVRGMTCEEISREVRRAGGWGRVCLGKTKRPPEANGGHKRVGFCSRDLRGLGLRSG